jgi:hypothetical protein
MIQIVVTRKTLPARSLLGPEVACPAPARVFPALSRFRRSVLEFPRAIFSAALSRRHTDKSAEVLPKHRTAKKTDQPIGRI